MDLFCKTSQTLDVADGEKELKINKLKEYTAQNSSRYHFIKRACHINLNKRNYVFLK